MEHCLHLRGLLAASRQTLRLRSILRAPEQHRKETESAAEPIRTGPEDMVLVWRDTATVHSLRVSEMETVYRVKDTRSKAISETDLTAGLRRALPHVTVANPMNREPSCT